ncbi:hypothetical protein ATK74_2487 [Propionicimonas paludicola]|uniref:Uncharacterized protein n=2 Tax=Propionicimonas paludicola TaxID=185243 RepID=A0A2A9CW98_9ACTN|nr:hypothetical protein ATK74_2487 [Propionicimonas paludicola]
MVDAYRTQAKLAGPSRFEIEIPSEYLEAAWLADWEAAYSIAITQTRTYLHSVFSPINPEWTAVTGYYAAFFSCRALLYGVGVGHRTLGRGGVLPQGLYDLRVVQGPSVNTSTLICKPQGQGGSHKAAWRELDLVLADLLTLGGLDLTSTNIISTLRTLISHPQHVSAFRNAINYSLDIASKPMKMWTSEIGRVSDVAALEQSLSTLQHRRGEHRIEVLLLATLSWQRDLYSDYLARAVRPDRRPKRQRAEAVALDGAPVGPLLQEWI